MKLGQLAFVIAAWLCAPAVFAQHSHPARGATESVKHVHGPYAGMQERAIKSLSEQQLSNLRAGKGMSLALPAELNGYPGPSHALELAEPLKLTAEQKTRTQALFAQMQQEARAAGEEVIAAEAALEALFKSKSATPDSVRTATGKAAVAQGHLRETHLRYHFAMVELLSPEQVAVYSRLRGY